MMMKLMTWCVVGGVSVGWFDWCRLKLNRWCGLSGTVMRLFLDMHKPLDGMVMCEIKDKMRWLTGSRHETTMIGLYGRIL